MGEFDRREKLLEDYNDVFADIYNTLLFQKPLLKEELLNFGPTESIYKNDNDDTAEQRRDVLKVYQDKANLVISSFGIENQSSYDKNMPIRVMSYDAGTYQQQLKTDKSKEIYPVITIVLNFSNREWSNVKDLHSLLNISEELKPFVSNYNIRVFDIAFLEDEVIESFTSDFKAIAKFFKDKRLKKDALAENTVELKYPTAVTDFLAVFTNDSRYAEINDYIVESQKRGECVSMCNVLQAYIDKGVEQGIEQGIERGIEQGIERGKVDDIRSLMANLKLNAKQAMAALGITETDYPKYEKLLKEIDKTA